MFFLLVDAKSNQEFEIWNDSQYKTQFMLWGKPGLRQQYGKPKYRNHKMDSLQDDHESL